MFERRHVTVVFCDIVGWTALAEALEPEDLAALTRAWHAALAAVMGEFDAHANEYRGDGSLTLFGYPVAREDDAERALRASLEALERIGSLRLASGVRLQARIGVASGLAVVGHADSTAAGTGFSVTGFTVNLAARLQELADPDTIVVADATRQRVGDLFDWQDLGVYRLGGLGDATRAWRLGAVRSADRFAARRRGPLAPLVGRRSELDALAGHWAAACAGAGQVLLVRGEAGIGKSRLLAELVQGVRAGPHGLLQYFCSPSRVGTPFGPVADHLQRACAFRRGDDAAARHARLAQVLGPLPAADFALIAPLVLGSEAELPAVQYAPQRHRERLMEAILGVVRRRAQAAPLALVVEDVHWADASTRDLLRRLVPAVATLPVLLVLTARPGFEPPWPAAAPVTDLDLQPLPLAEARDLMRQAAQGRSLPAALVDYLYQRADGIPLFVEELTRAVLATGAVTASGEGWVVTRPLSTLAVPGTLQELLVARLDGLPHSRAVAQSAALIGREFSFELLATASGLEPEFLCRALEQLIEAGVLHQVGHGADRRYRFHHALLQEAARESVPRASRPELHRRVAHALEAAGAAATDPEHLAYHLKAAGERMRSLEFWRLAGEQAARRAAIHEALTHLAEGLLLVQEMPFGTPRDSAELALQLPRAGVLRATRGAAAGDTGEAYRRAAELAGRLADPRGLVPALAGLYAFHTQRAEFAEADASARQLLRIGEQSGDPALEMAGCWATGSVLFHTGRPVEARVQLLRALDAYRAEVHGPQAFRHGIDHRCHAASNLAVTLFVLGATGEALELQRETVRYAESLGHVYSHAQALLFLCLVLVLDERPAELAVEARRALALARAYGFSMAEGVSRHFLGAAIALRGGTRRGLALMQAGARQWWATGACCYRPLALLLMARCHDRLGEAEQALAQLAAARDTVAATGERWIEPELLRLEAELAARRGAPTLAAQRLREALTLARAQGARTWEQRAAEALATVLQDGSRAGEATHLAESLRRPAPSGRDRTAPF